MSTCITACPTYRFIEGHIRFLTFYSGNPVLKAENLSFHRDGNRIFNSRSVFSDYSISNSLTIREILCNTAYRRYRSFLRYGKLRFQCTQILFCGFITYFKSNCMSCFIDYRLFEDDWVINSKCQNFRLRVLISL